VVKMATVLEVYTTEEWRSVLRSFVGKMTQCKRIFVNKYLLFTVGSVCGVKRFIAGSKNSLKDVRKSQMLPNHVRK
jgi:hypothetical protein